MCDDKMLPTVPADEEDAVLAQEARENTAILAAMINEIMSPVLRTMAEFMQHNTEALDRVAAAQKALADRTEALEKQIRLNTPVTPQQVKYIQAAIRKRSRELLMKKELDGDAQAVKKLTSLIRKDVNMRYGAGSLSEIPKHEYSVVLSQVQTWNDMLALRDVVREARERSESEEN